MTSSSASAIWLISKYASLPNYGPGSRLFYLAREFQQAGHAVVLITSDANHLARFPPSDRQYTREEIDGVTVVWHRTRKYKRTASIGRIVSWLDFERGLFGMPRKGLPKPAFVIVSSLSLLSILYGYYLKRVYGARLVFEIRDIWPLTMVEEGGFSRWHPLVVFLGLIERFGYRRADLVVGTMPRLDLHVRDVLGHDRPFFCSPLGYSPEWAEEETPLSDDSLNTYFPPHKVIVGYAGSIGITNALEPLMQCIERMSGRSDLHFVLVGSGDLRETYRERLSGLAHVTFAPRIDKNQVQSFLRRCDILYLSAHDSPVWRFGQSLNKMVDYMMAAKPIIASYSGHQSMLNEADAGVFVRAGDAEALFEALCRFIEMAPEERAEIGNRGRTWLLTNRSYRALGRAYLSAIERLVGR